MNDIRNLSKESLGAFVLENGVQSFRVNQIWSWLWKYFVTSFDEMNNLPLGLRNLLKEHFSLTVYKIVDSSQSADGTTKIVIELFDGSCVESVLIPSGSRLTACISTQVGCPVNCTFCATASLGFTRNLTVAEIYLQVVLLNKMALDNYGHILTNIVVMGMGEPFLNYSNVKDGIHLLNSEEGLNVSSSRITLSTVGIPKVIRMFADDGLKINLAVSLHAADNKKRSEIIPLNKTHSIEDVLEALDYYYSKTKKVITIEYVLLKDFNDTPTDAQALTKICRRIPSKVNIITFNSFDNSMFEKSDEATVLNFCQILKSHNINVQLRKSKGSTISAACGQLANKYKPKTS